MIEKLQLKEASFHYDPASPLLTDVTFEMPSGENVHITGVSGTGKSVLLKLLGGLLYPQKGSYLINDHNVTEMSFEEFLPFRKRIGYSFDYGGLLANRTIWDNLTLPLQYHNEVKFEEAEARVQELISRFKLDHVRDRRPAAVSGSVRKTANIARAFVMEPEMVILDDPFVGLDRDGVIQFLDLIEYQRKHKRLKHVFFTSRGEGVAAKLATCVLRLENGVLSGVPSGESEVERKAAG